MVLLYRFDTLIVAELPLGTQPGDYELTVTDSGDMTRTETVTITIEGGGPQKLEISGAEPDVGSGTILISGANLGDAATIPADFDVRLFVPDPIGGHVGINLPLPVTAFDPATQEIIALLPAGIFPGTFRLTVSKVAGNETDTLDVTLGDLDLDPTNELNTSVVLNGTSLDVTDAGGTLSAELSSLTADLGDGHSLDAADGNPADVVFVNNNGNVGIGTTSPAAKLHVNSGAVHIANAGGYLMLGTETGGAYIREYHDDLLAERRAVEARDPVHRVYSKKEGDVSSGTGSRSCSMIVLAHAFQRSTVSSLPDGRISSDFSNQPMAC